MRLRRLTASRYDPWPEIFEASMRHHRELMDRREELSVDQMRLAQARLRSAYEMFTVYATMGRDRRKLGPEFVAKADAAMADAVQFGVVFGKSSP